MTTDKEKAFIEDWNKHRNDNSNLIPSKRWHGIGWDAALESVKPEIEESGPPPVDDVHNIMHRMEREIERLRKIERAANQVAAYQSDTQPGSFRLDGGFWDAVIRLCTALTDREKGEPKAGEEAPMSKELLDDTLARMRDALRSDPSNGEPREGEVNHVDLFTGIGGFTLAAQWNGIKTVQFIEIDKRCRAFLAERWPGIPIHDDIRTFDGRQHAGAFLLTGGVPCQPASRAGKQKGKDDDRWLWGEAIRVLSEVRPAWALFENPPGIGDVGLAGILAEMESLGYQVRVFGVPACAVGAPHRRERYWIVAKSAEVERGPGAEEVGNMGDNQQPDHAYGSSQGDVADAEKRGSGAGLCESRTEQNGHGSASGHWHDAVWLPCADGKFRRAPDDSFGVAHGLHRSVLGALGNSIVPQVAYQIIKAMIESEPR